MSKKKKYILITVLLLVVTNITTFFASGFLQVSVPIFGGKVAIGRNEYEKYQEVESFSKKFGGINQIFDFAKLFSVRDSLYENYYSKLDEDKMVEGAVKGMTSALGDPYTTYMTKDEFSSFTGSLKGTYAGVGIVLATSGDNVTVDSTLKDSPAKNAGILKNDVIQKINGKAIKASDYANVANMIRGKEGSKVTLTMYREGKGNFDVTLTRKNLVLESVTSEVVDGNIGYMQISSFDENTGDLFNKAIKDLKSKNVKGIIVDLRENGGGYLDTSVESVSNFIPKGKLVVYTVDKNKKKESHYSKGGNAIGMPLVLLTDGDTASAAEIFTGAIRDYKLGTVIGDKTFGKGIVQETLQYNDGSALKVTVSKWYTPNGNNCQHNGFNPDIKVEYPKNLQGKAYDRNSDPQYAKALEVIKQKIK